MNNKLRITLALQLAFFLAWAGWLFSFSYRTAAEFCLDTVPVDPRDLLSGTYLALRYDIAEPKAGDCGLVMGGTRDQNVYVKLGPDGRTVNAPDKALPVYKALSCAHSMAQGAGGEVWARGSAKWGWDGRRLEFGIEKYFVNENDPRKHWSSGKFVARVKVDGLGNLRLVDLIEKPGGWVPDSQAAPGTPAAPRTTPPPPLPAQGN